MASRGGFGREEELIDFLRRHDCCSRVGDDAAFLPTARLAVTMDTQLEGRHFFAELAPELIARRSLAVNLSDVAAVGALPRFLFLALVAPRDFDFEAFFLAIFAQCEVYQKLELCGGDLTTGPTICVTMTVAGELEPGSAWLRRSNASAGQVVWLGGSIGESALGLAIIRRCGLRLAMSAQMPDELALPRSLHQAAHHAVARHLGPSPQLELGAWLAARSGSLGAAIDTSDGLAKDLHRLCRASTVGAAIELENLPVPDSTKKLCAALDLDWQELALCGGEDYVLLFSLDEGLTPPAGLGAQRIGMFTPDEGVELLTQRGRKLLKAEGWDHLSG